jgi:RimK family alpha-L-glutamate ligase
MQFALVAHRRSATNLGLSRPHVAGVEPLLLTPRQALLALRPGDVALARLDVTAELDGIEDGTHELERLDVGGVAVLNPPSALVAAHDKLLTARLLRRAALPHPQTTRVGLGLPEPELEFPLVLKPRYGSWGRDVFLCRDRAELREALGVLESRRWFAQHGALAQELVPPRGEDLRAIVAAGRVIGSARRVAAPGEWRTNVALGARIEPAPTPPEAAALARAAATAIRGDLVGVDLLPLPSGHWTILELNAAVDFRPLYSPAADVFAAAQRALIESVGAPVAA